MELFYGFSWNCLSFAWIAPPYSGIVNVYENVLGEETWCVLTHNPVVDGLLTSTGGYIINPLSLVSSKKGRGKSGQQSSRPCRQHRRVQHVWLLNRFWLWLGVRELIAIPSILSKLWVFALNSGAQSLVPHKSAQICQVLFFKTCCTWQEDLKRQSPSSLTPFLTCGHPRHHFLQVKFGKKLIVCPWTRSSLVQFGGQLLAIGGRDDSGKSTSNIYRYDPHSDSWTIITHMKNKRSECLPVTPLGDYLLVVGGVKLYIPHEESTDSVEILKWS